MQTTQTAGYIQFIKWFKQKHPKLFDLYAGHINVPKEDMRIWASFENVRPEHRRELVTLIEDYNNEHLD